VVVVVVVLHDKKRIRLSPKNQLNTFLGKKDM
jgi:hypothetical protein